MCKYNFCGFGLKTMLFLISGEYTVKKREGSLCSLKAIFTDAHNGMVRSQDLFWWKWLTGQAMAALNYKLNLRVMEQSGADQNCMGGIPPCLGAHNTIQICRKMHLDLTIPNSLI